MSPPFSPWLLPARHPPHPPHPPALPQYPRHALPAGSSSLTGHAQHTGPADLCPLPPRPLQPPPDLPALPPRAAPLPPTVQMLQPSQPLQVHLALTGRPK